MINDPFQIAQSCLDNASQPITWISSEGVIKYANKAYLEIFEFEPSEILDCYIWDVDKSFSKPIWEKQWVKIKKNKSVVGEYPYLQKNGNQLYIHVTANYLNINGEEFNTNFFRDITSRRKMEDTFSLLQKGLGVTGKDFFSSFIQNLALAFTCKYAFIGELIEVDSTPHIKALSIYANDSTLENLTYKLAGTPSETVLKNGIFLQGTKIRESFPDDLILQNMNAESYFGLSLTDLEGTPIGLIVVIDDNPIVETELMRNLLNIFASRASAEILRIRKETESRTNEIRLRAIIDNLPFEIWAKNNEKRYTVQNEVSLKNWGNKLGKSIHEVSLSGEVLERWALNNSKAFSGVPVQGEFQILKDSVVTYIEEYVSPVIVDNSIQGIVGVNIDVTQRKIAEQGLIKSEEKYRLLFTQMQSGFALHEIICDSKGRPTDYLYLEVNPAWVNMVGMKRSDVVGKTVKSFMPDIEPWWIEKFGKVALTGESISFEDYNNFSRKYYDVMAYCPEAGRFAVIFNDVTPRKIAIQELRKSETRYKLLADNANDLICQYSVLGLFVYVSPSVKPITGYQSEELIGTLPDVLIHPDDLKKFKTYHQKVIQHSSNANDCISYRFKSKSGEYIWLETLSKVLRDVASEYTMEIISTSRNITEKKQAEEQLRKLSRSVEFSPTSIIITNVAGEIEYINRKFSELTGYSLPEVKGQNPRILQSGFTPVEVYKAMWETLLAGQEWRGELYNRKKNGSHFWESASISSIKNESGVITHFLGVKEDITGKKILEKEIKQALDRAEEASALKSNLLGNMSHELRTPMNGILGFAQILHDEVEDLYLAEMAEKIVLSGNRLMKTLTSILSLSELESRDVKISIKSTDIVNCSNSVKQLYEHSARLKSLQLDLKSTKTKIFGLVDSKIYSLVLSNLIDNAIKYTNQGSVLIDIDQISDNNQKLISVTRITDTGIGIEEKNLNVIFEEFRQVSEGFGRTYEGNGLGLTLARKYARMLDGDITVKSEVGKGSVFELIVPGVFMDVSELATISDSLPSNLEVDSLNFDSDFYKKFKSKNVLIVEDNKINSELINFFIGEFCNLEWVDNPNEALFLASNKKYDIILMDIHLSARIDGVMLTQQIREVPFNKECKIIAVTGYAMMGDKEKLLSLGLDYYLEKPFSEKQLKEIINKILNEEL